MTEKTQEQNLKQNQPQPNVVAKFIIDVVVLTLLSWLFKTVWNIGVQTTVHTLPTLTFMQTISWLIALYIICRIIATAFVDSVEKMIINLLDYVIQTGHQIDAFQEKEMIENKKD